MAESGFGLAPPTGANQWSDVNYAMPGMTGSTRNTGGNQGDFAMFTAGGPSTSGALPNDPGVVPPASVGVPTATLPGTQQGLAGPNVYTPGDPAGPYGGVKNVGSGAATVNPLFPQFTEQFYNYLSSQLGKGATPFNLSALLPSSGKATTPGSLTAPLTDINSMLQQFYKTGSGGPQGTDTLAGMAQTGDPTDVGPAWQAMVDAQQRNIQRQGADLREQFAFGGDLKSSPFGQAATDFYSQTAKDQNALLAQMTQQAQEAAAGRKLTAGEDLTSGATSFGNMLQGLDQESIQNMLAEFIRTRPEYSPLLGQQGGAATTFPPTISGNVGVGGLGGAVSSAGTALSGIADLWSTLQHDNSSTATPAG
jgi:hypothetical protein